jgi:hypothetical protein
MQNVQPRRSGRPAPVNSGVEPGQPDAAPAPVDPLKPQKRDSNVNCNPQEMPFPDLSLFT